MRHLSKTRAILSAAVVSCGLSAAADAQSIGVNFVGGFGTPSNGTSLADTDVAGLVPQAHFNNASGASGTLAGLVDSGASHTGASLTWKSPNTWASGTDTTTPNGKLLNGYIDSNGTAAGGAMVSVTGVPYKVYDLVVYLNTDNGGGVPRVGDYEVVTSGGTLTQQVSYPKSSNLTLAPPVGDNTIPINATTPSGTAIVFAGLTDSTLTLETNQAKLPNVNFRAPISGFQIYSVPEPASLGVITVLGGLALRRSRRQGV